MVVILVIAMIVEQKTPFRIKKETIHRAVNRFKLLVERQPQQRHHQQQSHRQQQHLQPQQRAVQQLQPRQQPHRQRQQQLAPQLQQLLILVLVPASWFVKEASLFRLKIQAVPLNANAQVQAVKSIGTPVLEM